jgi:tRNA splicing ligase
MWVKFDLALFVTLSSRRWSYSIKKKKEKKNTVNAEIIELSSICQGMITENFNPILSFKYIKVSVCN